ncbi:MAG TPA: SDR family oxidoreductase [Thermoanaerobaculia bacterium]|nr:SDR family oxidoreductase [Thermoanaerobaculia bacterium]
MARELARRGAAVGLLARGEEGLEAAAVEVREAGGRALALPTDVADPAQVEAAAQAVEETLGPIDVWINNAMVTVMAPVKELTPEDVQRVTDVTYHGTVYGTLAALRRMLPRDRGTIVQVGSALAYRSIPLQAAYCAAKHAVAGFTDSLRSEILHDRSAVRLTAVHLPALNTPQFTWSKTTLDHEPQPLGKIFQPEVAARVIVHAARRPRRREYWVGASAVVAILGQRIAPAAGDRYLARVAVEGQQSDEPIDPRRRHNLYEPVPGDHGAHGPFDARARARSWQWRLSRNRGWLLAAAGLGAAAALGLRQQRRGDGDVEQSAATVGEMPDQRPGTMRNRRLPSIR